MDEPKKTAKKKIFVYLRIGFVLATVLLGVIWVCQEQRYVKLGQILGRMNGLFITGIVLTFVLSQMILASRWWLLLRTQGVHISIWAAVRLHFLGLFYNNFMPGSLGGDLIRAWYVTRHTTHRRFEAALSVFVDRLVGFSSSVIMAAFFYFVLLGGTKLGIGKDAGGEKTAGGGHQGWIIGGLVIFVLVVVLTFILPAGRRLVAKVWDGCLKLAKKLATAAAVYGRNPLTILAAFGLTFILQGIVITGFWLVGRHIGITASAKYYFVFFPMTWALGAIPVSIGGAGVVEIGLVSLFSVVAGVPAEQGLAIALCQRVVWMVAALPGAVIHLTGGHLPKEEVLDALNIDKGMD
jgi:uncharacterized membrane protein YbhN (UPF0104 family)